MFGFGGRVNDMSPYSSICLGNVLDQDVGSVCAKESMESSTMYHMKPLASHKQQWQTNLQTRKQVHLCDWLQMCAR